MKLTVDSKFGEIYYEERSFAGKKVIKINGQELTRKDRYNFVLGNKKKVEVEGNFLSGIGLYIDGQYILIYPKGKWYEYILCAIPFLIFTVWGSVNVLYNILPLAPGVTGGAINAAFAIAAIVIERTLSKTWQRILDVLIFAGLAFLVVFLVGYNMY